MIFRGSVQGEQSSCRALIDSFSCIVSRQYSEMKHVCLLEQLHCGSSVFESDLCWKAIYHTVVMHSQSGTPLSKRSLSGNEYVGTGGGKLISTFYQDIFDIVNLNIVILN